MIILNVKTNDSLKRIKVTPHAAQTVQQVMQTGTVLCDVCGQPHFGSTNVCYRCRPVIDYNRNPGD